MRPTQQEPLPPGGRPALRDRGWVILAVVCVAVFTINVDTTLVNVALPTLVRELGASTSQLQWVASTRIC